MITLHYSPSTAALVVHWLLIELEIPHTLKKVDLDAGEHKQPPYLALNPAGVVPTLVIDGQPIHEAAAIALHLVDAYPARGLAPEPGTLARAAYYQWMFYCANTLQPAFRAWFYPNEPAGEANVDAVKAQARARIEAAWDRLDRHLAAHGPYLLGDAVSTADFMLTMMMRWSRNMPRTANAWPALDRLAAAMKARPSFNEVYAREGLTDWT
jgi:glutathione S-transferase